MSAVVTIRDTYLILLDRLVTDYESGGHETCLTGRVES
jgi:hypothetical protein